jgi:hypothetical protein
MTIKNLCLSFHSVECNIQGGMNGTKSVEQTGEVSRAIALTARDNAQILQGWNHEWKLVSWMRCVCLQANEKGIPERNCWSETKIDSESIDSEQLASSSCDFQSLDDFQKLEYHVEGPQCDHPLELKASVEHYPSEERCILIYFRTKRGKEFSKCKIWLTSQGIDLSDQSEEFPSRSTKNVFFGMNLPINHCRWLIEQRLPS